MKADRILIFNVNWLGDVLFSTAVIRNVRRNFPNSYLASAIPSRCYPVLKGNPYLDEVIIFDEKDRHSGLLPHLQFVRMLKDKQFDTVFLLHRSFSRALICRLAGISQRIGYKTKKRALLLTKGIPLPKKDSLHRIDYYLNVIEKAGLKVEDRYLEFFVDEEEITHTENLLAKHGISNKDFLVAINPGGNWQPKRWPKECWAELADKLISELGAKVIITGSNSDLALALEIKSAMKHEPFIACGKFNVKQFAALARKVSLFITADTGPLHIANSVGAKKIIALFGPTSAEITGPYPLKNVTILQKNVGCPIPCYEVNCKDNRCMRSISVEDVMEEARFIHKHGNP
jgi:heptosyltransferase II